MHCCCSDGEITGNIWSAQNRSRKGHPHMAIVTIIDQTLEQPFVASNLQMSCFNPGCIAHKQRNNFQFDGCKHCISLLIERQEKLQDEPVGIEEVLNPLNEEGDEKTYKYERILAKRKNNETQEEEFLVKWRSLRKQNGQIKKYGYGKDLRWIPSSDLPRQNQASLVVGEENIVHYTGVDLHRDVVDTLKFQTLKRVQLF